MGKYKFYHGTGRSKVTVEDKPGVVSWTCPECGKAGYRSRKDAKDFARVYFPGRRMRYYQCGDSWHVTSYSTAKVTAYREFERK